MHRVDDSRGFGATFERILPLLLTVLAGLKDPAAGAGLGLGFLESRDLQPDRFRRQQQIDIQRRSEQQQAALTSARIQEFTENRRETARRQRLDAERGVQERQDALFDATQGRFDTAITQAEVQEIRLS